MLKAAVAPTAPPASSGGRSAAAPSAVAPAPKLSLVAAVAGLARAVYSLDWDGDSSFAIGGGDMPVRVFDLVAGALVASHGCGEAACDACGQLSVNCQHSPTEPPRITIFLLQWMPLVGGGTEAALPPRACQRQAAAGLQYLQ